ncbi:MAG: 16S rRNA (guanine(527)-N(7))-methyltransferase RsmG [Firmicutes bacterium]|nr:16S rRNA (guanine(527)-N(7))-methyltransferase RsmG [Bacillota bacterium]
MSSFSTLIYNTCAQNDGVISIDNNLAEKLGVYLENLLETNKKMNLTAIRSPEDAALKHFADCLTVVPLIPRGAKLIDVGSGAGLPAIPIALSRPDVSVTALDSTGKKAAYIASVAQAMEISNLNAVCGRAEELGRQHGMRESFDTVTARALARLNVLCELCLPFVRVGGVFISMKGPLADEEITEARQALKTLGGEMAENKRLTLSCGGESIDRALIIIQKVGHTPINYPRNNSAITKNPL